MLCLPSPAKINLYLEVFGRRPDGYHELGMVMQKLALHDKVTVRKVPAPVLAQVPTPDLDSAFSSSSSSASSLSAGSEPISITCTDPAIPTDSRNLVWKAAALLIKDFPEAFAGHQVHIHLEKAIPSEAGLAGGSSNAATALVGISRLFGLNLDQGTLCHYGAQIGSDVNFFFYGPTCLATGRGEMIKEIEPPLPRLHVLLVKPSEGLGAGAVYQKLHELRGTQEEQRANEEGEGKDKNKDQDKIEDKDKVEDKNKVEDVGKGKDGKPTYARASAPSPDLAAFIQAISRGPDGLPYILQHLHNRLEAPAFALLPQLRDIRRQLEAMSPATLMSGSGTTFFALFPAEEGEAARRSYLALRNHYPFVTLTSTTSTTSTIEGTTTGTTTTEGEEE